MFDRTKMHRGQSKIYDGLMNEQFDLTETPGK